MKYRFVNNFELFSPREASYMFISTLNRYLKRYHIPVSVLAKEIGVSRSAMSNYTNLYRNIPFHVIMNIVYVLGGDFEELLDIDMERDREGCEWEGDMDEDGNETI